jgi:hypothetical protein
VAASVEAYIDALNAMLGVESWAGAAAAAGSRRAASRAASRAADAGDSSTEYDADADRIDTTEWFNR